MNMDELIDRYVHSYDQGDADVMNLWFWFVVFLKDHEPAEVWDAIPERFRVPFRRWIENMDTERVIFHCNLRDFHVQQVVRFKEFLAKMPPTNNREPDSPPVVDQRPAPSSE